MDQPSWKRLSSRTGNRKRYLHALTIAFVCAATPEVIAQICCPSNCVQEGNSCVTTGPNPRSCGTISCSSGSSATGGGSLGGSGGGQFPAEPHCVRTQVPPAQLDAATNKCVAALVANAQLIGCLFEDAAGKAEDQRTGLTCPSRQAALAKQCRSRCANFANATTGLTCKPDEDFYDNAWQTSFGDIGGQKAGSARVQDCGPALLSKAEKIFNATKKHK